MPSCWLEGADCTTPSSVMAISLQPFCVLTVWQLVWLWLGSASYAFLVRLYQSPFPEREKLPSPSHWLLVGLMTALALPICEPSTPAGASRYLIEPVLSHATM